MEGLKRRLLGLFPVRLMVQYAGSQASNYAAGLAFNAFMTMFPLLAGLIAVVGFVFKWDPGFQQGAEAQLASSLPGASAHDVIQGVTRHASTIGIASLLGLVWTGTGFFAAVEFALDRVYRVRQRDFLHQRLMGLLMLLVFVAAVVLAVFANAAIAFLPYVPYLGLLVGALVMVALFATIYLVVPNRRQTVREVLPGAVLAGVLVEVLTLLFPLYLRLVRGFTSYGSTFALFLLLATWLYFLSQFILLGAVLNEMRLGRVPEPEAGSQGPPGEDAQPPGGEFEPVGGRDLEA